MFYSIAHILVLCLSIFSTIATAVQVQHALPPFHYPISNEYCPVIPAENRTECGKPTYRFCDTPTAPCDYCHKSTAPASATPPGYFNGHNKEVRISPLEYLTFKSVEIGYTVEFMKNPLPWERKVDLPYCGLPKPSSKRDTTPSSETLLQKRGWPPQWVSDAAHVVTPPILDKIVDEVGNIIEKGVASIDIPWTEKRPPRIIQPPLCLPTAISVPIHFTIFTTNLTTSSLIGSWVLEEQLKRTNKAFAPLRIQFFIATVTYHIGEEWRRFTQHRSDDENAAWLSYAEPVKAQNRYGGNDEVSIWIVESIDQPNCKTGVRTEGFCTLARNLGYPNHGVDGCVVELDTLPGVSWKKDYGGDGSTLTHELGHWFDLDHIFPDESGEAPAQCKGESDGIADTFQFQNSAPTGNEMFEPYQRQCCLFPDGHRGHWDFCDDATKIHVANYMSYSSDMGKLLDTDQLGSKPWTSGQRVHMFTSFFTQRRISPPQGVDATCRDWIVYPDTYTPTFTLIQRSFSLKKLVALIQKQILHQAAQLTKTLERVCSKPRDPNTDSAINVVTGEEVMCTKDGCQPPPGGPICPDGTAAPCKVYEVCEDNSLPPCDKAGARCYDGSVTPCPGQSTCPSGQALQCSSIKDSPGPGTGSCPDGSTPPCPPTGSPEPKTGTADTAICPKPCNVYFNSCDATTAPTCIFPDPKAPKPRAACACRPGYKANGYADGDTTKQWRLPIVGQEHRVWVAEGVKCDTICKGYGVDSCREVAEISEACIG